MSLASELLPPIVFRPLQSVKNKIFPPESSLFDGDSELFKRVVATCTIYGEYGVGASTNWIYENTNAQIIANESSAEWAHRTLQGKDTSRIDLEFVDIGPIAVWGWPLDYRKRENFRNYQDSIWQKSLKPDVVLIDGRFRVACFLASILNGSPGLRIIFDDYLDRTRYHVVEEIASVKERCGRQVMFELDANVDLAKAALLRDKFEFVLD